MLLHVCTMRTLFTIKTNDHIKTDDLFATASRVQRYKRYDSHHDSRACISVVLINPIVRLKQRAYPGGINYIISLYWYASLADIISKFINTWVYLERTGKMFPSGSKRKYTQLCTHVPEKRNNIPQDLRRPYPLLETISQLSNISKLTVLDEGYSGDQYALVIINIMHYILTLSVLLLNNEI